MQNISGGLLQIIQDEIVIVILSIPGTQQEIPDSGSSPEHHAVQGKPGMTGHKDLQ
jgi:hypothetical protein